MAPLAPTVRLLSLAALFNLAWALLFLAIPDRLFRREFPGRTLFSLAVGGLGLLFALGAARATRPILAAGLLAKSLGPLVFLAGTRAGVVPPAAFPLTIVTDLLWIPPFLRALQREADR